MVRKTRLWFLVALALKLVQGYLHPPQDVAKTIGVPVHRRGRAAGGDLGAGADPRA